MRTFSAEDNLKAQQSRRDKIAAGQHFKRDWLDSPLWDSMAQKRGIRLPAWHVPPTPRKLAMWSRMLVKEEISSLWGASPNHLIALNPHQPLRAWIGQLLEVAEEQN